MKSPLKGDESVGVPYSKSGLRDAHRRGIMRLIFVATGITLAIFAVFQVFNNNPVLALLELGASVLLLFGATRVMKTSRLHAWIYGYLVCAFSFFLYIITMPEASSTAFVWVFIMPILSYLLLGRVAGFFLAFPFMLAGGVFFYLQLNALTNAGVMIDLLNPMFCAILILMFMHVYESRRADAQARLVTLAETDALTGMANRSSFHASLERVLRESQRNRRQFALVLMDIDHFKRVNDSLGHVAGDEVLRHIGRCLTERLRNTDFVGRLGGEEFGLIVREVAPRDAEGLVNELRQRIADTPAHYEGIAVELTATFGIAFWPADAEKLNELYQIADRRLYEGKSAGRNRVVASSSGSEMLASA
ncbi:GGDEF domain-containing protein [Marinobacter salicampi]|uniref:GGDEF domain-containing protein n=1 Tax=Marinobacter salicampi TaxID=435907 RepID=UPI001409199D|nr:GGDEF domain-containing protein [Marinobacter salicampi]